MTFHVIFLTSPKYLAVPQHILKVSGVLMREVETIAGDVTEIYRKSGSEAEKYLSKVRKLGGILGPGPAIIYCWFYSVPQKWTQVEPKIFELMECTNSFDLDVILSMPPRAIASVLKPMIFCNQISAQLKRFCSAIKDEYNEWNNFAEALRQENIFAIFWRIRKNRNVRVTFKNLAAMKAFVGLDDDLVILDTHVAKVMGIGRNELSNFRTHESPFKNLLETAKDVTAKLRKEYSDVATIKWSLAIWFNATKISAIELLTERVFHIGL